MHECDYPGCYETYNNPISANLCATRDEQDDRDARREPRRRDNGIILSSD